MKSSPDQGQAVNYGRWAQDTASPRGLGRAQRAVLIQLALRADRRGCCHPSIERLADDAGYGVSTTKRALADLERLRLIRSTRRGRRAAVRQLCPDAPMPAAPSPCGTLPLFDADLQPAVTGEPVAAPEVSSGPSEVSPASPRSTQGEGTEEGTRAARAAATDHAPRTDAPGGALQPRLDEVLAILERAPGLLIEPLAVDSALAAYPEACGYDHLRAAHTVASWAFEADGVRVGTANRLLMAALRKQRTPAPGPATPARWHDGRSRRGAPEPPRKPWSGALRPVVEEIKLRDAQRAAAVMQR